MEKKPLHRNHADSDKGPNTKPSSSVFRRFKDRFKMLLLAGAVAASASCTFDIRAQMVRDASVPNDVAADVTNPGEDAKKEDARQDDARQEDAQQDAADDASQDDASASDASPDGPKPWWDTNWSYCRKINISGSFPSGYSHKVTLTDPDFDYSHAKTNLGDLRIFEGPSCENPNLTVGSLDPYDETVNSPGESKIWFKTKTADITSVVMYYGNPNATGTFDGKKTFIAFGKDSDFSDFTENDTKNALTLDGSGVNFLNFPYGDGSGVSYLYKDVGDLSGDFIFDFTVKYTRSTSCYVELMVGVTDTLAAGFDLASNGVGYVRGDCNSPPKSVILRVRKNDAVVDNLATSFVPADDSTYHARIKKTGSTASIMLFSSKTDREDETNALDSVSSSKAPIVNLRYVYAPTALIGVVNNTHSTDGNLNEVVVRYYASPAPTYTFDAEETK